MKDFLTAARLLLLDLASTLFFLVVYLLTHNTILAVGLGIALGLAQIGTQFIRGKPIHAMEWLSLVLIIAAGIATLLTHDPRFVLFKPSVIYAIVGGVMCKPGWLNRYLAVKGTCDECKLSEHGAKGSPFQAVSMTPQTPRILEGGAPNVAMNSL